MWPNQDPIGRFMRLETVRAPQQVIGLTATGKYWSLAEPARPFLYRSPANGDAVSVPGDPHKRAPRSLAPRVAQEIQRVNQDLPPMPVQTAQERLRAWLEPERAAAMLLSILGLAALGLAITGLYALLAQLVAQRAPEIATRVALGASRAAVAGMLLRQSGLLILAGSGDRHCRRFGGRTPC